MNRLVKRLLTTIPLLFAVITLTFVITRIGGGDPADQIAPAEATQEQIQQIRVKLGTDKPLLEQYVDYLGDIVHLDLGTSYFTNRPVFEELRVRIPSTLELIFLGMVVAVLVGVSAGTMAAWRRGSGRDRAVRASSFVILAVPEFWIGLMLLYVFFFRLGWAPPAVGQLGSLDAHPEPLTNAALIDSIITLNFSSLGPAINYAILPVITLGVGFAAPIARLTRDATLDVLQSDYVRWAQSCGLDRRVVRRYAMRASLAPVVSFVGILFSVLLGGAVLVEQVFSWGGAAQYVADAAQQSDYPVVQGFVLIAGVFSVFVFLIVDLILQWMDPRVRLDN